jgi:isopenicillin N synthase-like dioxygenase
VSSSLAGERRAYNKPQAHWTRVDFFSTVSTMPMPADPDVPAAAQAPVRRQGKGHAAFLQLPVVDIADLRSPDPARRRAAAAALGAAAREAGFLYVTGHGVPAAVVDRLTLRARAYFAQPLAAKMRDYIGSSANHSGYVPPGEEQYQGAKPDLKEAYDVGFDLHDPGRRRPMLGPNRWSDFAGFREDVNAYYQAVFELSQRLFRGFALALDVPEDAFTCNVTAPPSQLRLIHYLPPVAAEANDDRPGIGAHTDYECFTILLPTADGLEVLNGAGQWIDAPVIPGTFVINIGDMLEVLSNGQFVATLHRVRRVHEERYSFPLFCACDYDTVIAPMAQLCPPGTAGSYEPLVCGDHLYAQTMQTFAYLKDRLARGELRLPERSKALASFGPRPTEQPAAVTERLAGLVPAAAAGP